MANVHFGLNRFRLGRLAALLSFALFVLCFWKQESNYSPITQQSSGYKSSISVFPFGCVAFRRDDGTLQFNW